LGDSPRLPKHRGFLMKLAQKLAEMPFTLHPVKPCLCPRHFVRVLGMEHMLCNECNQHPAKVSLTQIIRVKKKRRYLCVFCAKSVTFTPTPRVLSGEMWEYMKTDDPLLEIVAHDARYGIDAYHFVLEACMKLWEKAQ